MCVVSDLSVRSLEHSGTHGEKKFRAGLLDFIIIIFALTWMLFTLCGIKFHDRKESLGKQYIHSLETYELFPNIEAQTRIQEWIRYFPT